MRRRAEKQAFRVLGAEVYGDTTTERRKKFRRRAVWRRSERLGTHFFTQLRACSHAMMMKTMAKKEKKEGNGKNKNGGSGGIGIREETRHGVFSILFFLLAILSVLAAFEQAGVAGTYFYRSLSALLGIGYFILPLVLTLLAVSVLKGTRRNLALSTGGGALLFFAATLGIVDIVGEDSGGMIGGAISSPALAFFDVSASLVILFSLFVISLLVMFDTHPRWESLAALARNLFSRRTAIPSPQPAIEPAMPEATLPEQEEEREEEPPPAPAQNEEGGLKTVFGIGKKKAMPAISADFARTGSFTPPPLSLLEGDRGKPGVGDIKANANIIKRTLQNFGIDVEMDEVTIGPSVTRYALKPAEGVRLSKILGLQNNLELALAAHPVRIEAPIPGKSLVGIEIPNNTKTTIGLGSLLAAEAYQKSPKPLLLGLGKDIGGNPHFADLAKMPHLLIAGATGAGKSVTIHAIVNSLLFRNPPEQMRFIMIDPKRVELTLYNGIHHLLTPVITDAKKAILTLKWAAKEMERRYNVLEQESVRDISSYHKLLAERGAQDKTTDGRQPTTGEEETEAPERMPYIVIIIDELADIMTAYPRELESAIVRLAQMSRAVGIHLILSTQRPSVNVITGLIKANIPARVALQVTSQIDSRTILDTSGAEKLLGAGDMLYISGEMSKPIRVQSAFISETEVKKVVKFIARQYGDEIPQEIVLSGTGEPGALASGSFDDDDLGDDDELYEEARELVIESGKASSSFLQRRLKVGYARAARLLDMLEERGVVGPGEGSKPREVLEKPAVHE